MFSVVRKTKFINKIEDLEQLTQFVTQIIFTSGPQHAAVNYPQWDFMGFMPNMPLAGYAPYPTSKDTVMSEADLMKILPPHRQSATQELLMYSLSSVKFPSIVSTRVERN